MQTKPHPTLGPESSRGQGQTIDLSAKLELIDKHWQPHVVAEMNDYQFKLAKLSGDFIWHTHGATDETFIVLEGELRIDLRDAGGKHSSIFLRAGQMAVVPQGVEHKPSTITGEVQLLLIEPRNVVNTGDSPAGSRTTASEQWI